jgi:hypothetical protein
MESLEAFFTANNSRDIHTIARYVQQHVNAEWEIAFEATQARMVELYPQIGDSVYAMYGKRLFQHIHDQFKTVGLQATPKLPGSLPPSREWGDDESDRQRWMWSKITTTDGKPVGTLVCVYFHDHIQIRIPRAPQIMALQATSKTAVIAALSSMSGDFKAAVDMKAEIALYFQQLEAENNA